MGQAKQYLDGDISADELMETITSSDVGDFIPALIDVTDKDVEDAFSDDVDLDQKPMDISDVIDSGQDVVVVK
jgi:hypothetical protein